MPSNTYYPETKYKSRLSRSCGAADTTLYVNALPTQSTGILMIDKDSDDNYEIILYGATAGAGTTASPYTLTGVVRGLASNGVTLTAGTGKAHGKVEIGCTDVHYFDALVKDHLDDIQVMPQVANTAALPTSSNTQYDLRYVRASAAWYYWTLASSTGSTSDWALITSGGTTTPATETVNGISVAGDFTVAEQTTGGADLPIYGGTGANQSAAQSYTPSLTKKINQIVLSVKKTGTPTDNLVVTLYSDSGGNPNAVIAASGTLAGASVTTSYVDYAFTWSSEQTNTQGTTYHYVIERSGARDTSNYFQVQYNSASDAFHYGSLKKNDSAAWSANNYDLDFELRNTTPRFTSEYDQGRNHPVHVGVDIGANDTYAFWAWPAPVAYYTGMLIAFKANTANTGACTVNVNGLGAKSIKVNQNSDPTTGDFAAGQWIEAVYDGTNFQAFGQFSPITTKGDLETYSTTRARLAVGSNGQVIVADSAATPGIKWASQLTPYMSSAASVGTLSSSGNVDTTFTTNFTSGLIFLEAGSFSVPGTSASYVSNIRWVYDGTTLKNCSYVYIGTGTSGTTVTGGMFVNGSSNLTFNSTSTDNWNGCSISVASVTSTTVVVRMTGTKVNSPSNLVGPFISIVAFPAAFYV